MSQSFQEGSCKLSPVDQLMPRMYTTMFLVFETADFKESVRNLNEGLAKAASLYAFLRGSIHNSPLQEGQCSRNELSLSWSSSDASPAVVINTTNAPDSLPSFETLKAAGAPLEVFKDSLAPVSALINHTDHEARYPAIVVGATQIDGGLILCLCAHHVVMDGTGMGFFLKIWGDCTRNDAGPAKGRMSLDPQEPYNREQWIRDASNWHTEHNSKLSLDELLLRHPEYSLRSRSGQPASMPINPINCAAQIFSCSRVKIQKAIQSLSPSGLPAKILTINNVLGAALWLSITRIRLARMRHDGSTIAVDDPTSKLGFAVNARSKLESAMPGESYLGNLTMLKVVEFPVTELESIAASAMASLTTANSSLMAPIITAIAEATSSVTAEHISQVVAFADQISDFEDVGPGWNAHNGLDLTYTSWANLGMYDCDFGPSLGGEPRFVRIPYMPYIDGMVLALPRNRLSGGDDEKIEVAIMLNEQDMKVLEEDKMLRSWRV